MEHKKSKYQRYVVETIKRSDINNADYNPRIMDESARKKLKKGLKEHGLVEAIVWNKKTGNIVGGHQRIENLDALEKNKDYSLDVCVINVDEREEAVLNVQLNNPSIQGDWDLEKLALMNLEMDIDFSEMGFDNLDVDFMFDGDDRFTQLFETPEAETVKEKLEAVKDARAKGNEILAERNNINFYSVLVFENEDEKRAFYKKINTPLHEEYITTDILNRLNNKR